MGFIRFLGFRVLGRVFLGFGVGAFGFRVQGFGSTRPTVLVDCESGRGLGVELRTSFGGF